MVRNTTTAFRVILANTKTKSVSWNVKHVQQVSTCQITHTTLVHSVKLKSTKTKQVKASVMNVFLANTKQKLVNYHVTCNRKKRYSEQKTVVVAETLVVVDGIQSKIITIV